MAIDLASSSLLQADEPPAYQLQCVRGASPFLLICDHASRRIPRVLGTLGLSETDLQRHIAWDIGAAGVASHLSEFLDAFLITQGYSRLVIDCNRPLDSAGSIVARSEMTDIPGNVGLTADAIGVRAREIFEPYHARIAAELDQRTASGRRTILVSVHSFTPEFKSVARPWHIGMLYGNDARVAERLLTLIRREQKWHVGDNEPYAVTATTDYAIPVHGERRGIANIGLEIRQDLIEDSDGQRAWAERIARWLLAVEKELA